MWRRSACRTRDPSGSTRSSSPLVTSMRPSRNQLTAQPLPPPPAPMTSRFPWTSTATISFVPQFENHRRPSCHRGDSPMPKPSSRTLVSETCPFDMAFSFLSPQVRIVARPDDAAVPGGQELVL